MRLKKTIDKNQPDLVHRKGVVFHDNARPHSSIPMHQKMTDLAWDMLMHPSYNLDFAPSDFHLFWLLHNSLGSIKLASKEHGQATQNTVF